MRVIFAMPSTGLGFFPGLARPVIIDTARLAELDAHELEALVAAARVFERPPASLPATTGADRRHYAITVEQGNRRCELLLIDPIDDPDLQRLVRFLEAQAAVLRQQRSPGGGR